MECVEGETLAKRLGEGTAAARTSVEIHSADFVRNDVFFCVRLGGG